AGPAGGHDAQAGQAAVPDAVLLLRAGVRLGRAAHAHRRGRGGGAGAPDRRRPGDGRDDEGGLPAGGEGRRQGGGLRVPAGADVPGGAGEAGAGGGLQRRPLLRRAMELTPDFDKAGGLIPAIAQDAATGQVLMLAWMNREAWEETLRTRRAVYFSRSRNKLWRKGEESGNVQEVQSIYIDCDADTILLKVNQLA